MIGQSVEQKSSEPVWGLVDLIVFFTLALPIFVVAFQITLTGLKSAGVEPAGIRALLGQIAGYFAVLVPLFAIFRFRYGQSPMQALRMGVSLKESSVSISLGILTAVAITLLSVLLRTPSLPMPMEELLKDNASLIAVAITAATIGPWFEELVFRGLLQPLVGRYTGTALAIVLAALPFALLHGPQYGWSWRHVLLITLAGSAFGLRRYLTNSTGAAAVMHAAYNGVLSIALIAGRFAGADLPRTT